jgi:hypothetical protein
LALECGGTDQDHNEGRAMYKPEYPEWGRREAMLWAIHEWVQDRPAGDEVIRVEQLATLVRGGEYVNPMDDDPNKQAARKFQTEQINLFRTLVNEGLIDADIEGVEEQPVIYATVRRLTRQGLQMIQELPDPSRSLLDRLDDMTVAIRGLQDVPEEDKEAAEKALEVLKDFAQKFGQAVAVQILLALIMPQGR